MLSGPAGAGQRGTQTTAQADRGLWRSGARNTWWFQPDS